MRRPTQAGLAALLASLVTGTLALLPAAEMTAASATPATVNAVHLNGYEARLVTDLNNTRATHGLRGLVVVPGATDVARRWAWQLAGVQALSHNPNLVNAISAAGSSAWTEISENVGVAPSDDPDALFAAYMASPPHRANILDPQSRYLGVGVVERDGAAWNTLDFTDAYSSSYGATRVPADGLAMDAATPSRASAIAQLSAGRDQRFGTAGSGGMAASTLTFASGHLQTTITRRSSTSGGAYLFLRDAVNYSHVTSLRLLLAGVGPSGRTLPVAVMLSRGYGRTVSIGTVRLSATARWYTLALPDAARTLQDSVTLRVASSAIASVGGRARLAVYSVAVNT